MKMGYLRGTRPRRRYVVSQDRLFIEFGICLLHVAVENTPFKTTRHDRAVIFAGSATASRTGTYREMSGRGQTPKSRHSDEYMKEAGVRGHDRFLRGVRTYRC